MDRGAKPAKAKVIAKPPVVRPSRTNDGAGERGPQKRLTEALAQQTAISEILRVISASPTDVQPVLDAVAERAAHLCHAPFARVFLVNGDVLRSMAHYSIDGEPPVRVTAVPLTRTSITGRAAVDGQTVHHEDVVPLLASEYPDARENARRQGFRAVLAVPLMREGGAYGAIFLWRRDPGRFAPDQVALVQTFARQVAIAIDNVRLFQETKEALEQQTATSEILGVISRSPTDAQPVFETIAANALRLCDARFSTIFRFDGELIHIAAFHNLTPDGAAAFRSAYPCRPSRGGATQRAILTRSIAHIPDIREDPEYVYHDAAKTADFRSALSVPMLRDGHAIGTITVYRDVPRPFPGTQVELLKTFADQAVIAIENVRLFNETKEALDQQTATSEILRVISSSPGDIQPVLETVVRAAARFCGAPDGDEGIYQSRVREILIRLGYRSLLAVPLLREDHLLGGLAVNRTSAGAFAPQVIDLLKTFATQSALAIQNARLFREIEDKGRQLETASRHKSEFLANMSHELRTPLNAIIGFSEVLSERMFGEVNDKQAEYLADILESGRHLLSLINDILDLSKIEAGRMDLEPTEFELPSVIENTLILVRQRAQRRAITLGRTVDERLGMICADERKVKQVLLNLLSNALKFTPEGGSPTRSTLLAGRAGF